MKARDVFSDYAGLDHPEVPADRLSALQCLHVRWGVAQWGVQQPYQMVLGICEELLEELPDALDKDDNEAIQDAAADALIFGMGLATQCRLDYGTLLEEAAAIDSGDQQPFNFRECTRLVGRMSRLTLKREQGIRGVTEPVFRILAAGSLTALWVHMLRLARERDFDLEKAFTETAERVMRRDWKADAQKGGEQ